MKTIENGRDGLKATSHDSYLVALFIPASKAMQPFLVATINEGATKPGSIAAIVSFLVNSVFGAAMFSKRIANRPSFLIRMCGICFVALFVAASCFQSLSGYEVWEFSPTLNDCLVISIALAMRWALSALLSVNNRGSVAFNVACKAWLQ